GRNSFFAERIHLSHHVFDRSGPILDYQPRDWNSWWRRSGVSEWGGTWVRLGVYWRNPTTIEYYIDGQLERIVANDAISTRLPDGTWEHTYPAGFDSNGLLLNNTSGPQQGFQAMNTAASLAAAQAASNISVIDPYNYLNNGYQITQPLDIIINVEDQSWQAIAGRTPTVAELANFQDNNLLVDWIRVYKPVSNGNGGSGNPSLTIEAESFSQTGGSYNDGVVPFGANKAGTIINYVNGADWVEYPITIPQDGAYEVNYVYAVPGSGRSLQFSVSGTPFFTHTLPSTGSYGNFQTYTAPQTANFTAGNHLLRLTAGSQAWQMNLDKIILTRVGGMNTRQARVDASPKLGFYPNPVRDKLFFEGLERGQAIEMYDLMGKCVKHHQHQEGIPLSVGDLQEGLYLIRVRHEPINEMIRIER
ncbi:MAG: carbohydrate-binding protein, partial [Bacteroidota bacterium]